jgi:outer membrane receptor for ferrienterochelin and colicin
MFSKVALIFSCLFLWTSSAWAQQDSMPRIKTLKDVRVRHKETTTKIDSKSIQQVTLISGKELLKAACCNLSESFETTPSIDVSFTDAVSGYKQIQLLGLASANTLITRENIPDNRGLAAITGLSLTPGTWISSMQLSKGTGSVVNGFESLAGQLNVEWKNPFDNNRFYFNAYQNSQGRSEANAIWAKKVTKKISTNLLAHYKNQWAKMDQNKDGFTDQPLGDQWVLSNRWIIFLQRDWEVQVGAKFSKIDNWGGQLNYEKGEDQSNHLHWGYLSNLQRADYWMKIGKVFAATPWKSIGIQMSYVQHDEKNSFGLTTYSANQKSNYVNFIYQTKFKTTDQVVRMGMSWQQDILNETFYQAFQRNEKVLGAFSEATLVFSNAWSLVAGMRLDHHTNYGFFTTPRLHVRYAPNPSNTFRFSLGKALRTASLLSEQKAYMASNRSWILHNDAQTSANPYGLRPEVAWNTGLNWNKKMEWDYRPAALSIECYKSIFTQQVVVDIEQYNEVHLYNLQGQSSATALQVQLDYELAHHLDLRLAYKYYDVRIDYQSGTKQKPFIPSNRMFVNVAYQTRNKIKLDATWNWVGSKRVPIAYQSAAYLSPAFAQVAFQISKEYQKKYEWYLGVENALNYMQTSAIILPQSPFDPGFDAAMIWGPLMGRSVYAGVRLKIK